MNVNFNTSRRITTMVIWIGILFGLWSIPFASIANPEVEVMHWWHRGGELRAMHVIKDEFEERGGIWYDVPGENSIEVLNSAVSRMAKGYAPTLVQWNSGWELSQIRNLGLLNNLEQKTSSYLKSAFIDNVLDMVMVNGEIVAIPVNVHSENWLWYKPRNLIDNNPKVLSDWNRLITFAETLDKDQVLLAVGDEPQQQRTLFNNVLLGMAGQNLFQRIYNDLDVTAINTSQVLDATYTFAELKKYSHSFGDGGWEKQLAAVAANKAFTVSMGDWAKGEFRNLGLKLGRDYDCALAPGTEGTVALVIDAFVLGQVSNPDEKAGQELFMEVITDPVVSETFNYLKGSLSSLREFDVEGLDECSRVAHATLSKRGKAVKPYASIGDRGFLAAVDHLISKLWSGDIAPTDWVVEFSGLIEREKTKRKSSTRFSENYTDSGDN